MGEWPPDYVRAMKSAEFFPHPVEAVRLRETHISWVFLTGSYVYKVKKPVKLDFLDFSTLEKREYFCRREVELNRRLTSGVYLDVVPITQDGARFNLAGEGQPVEYAVKMRQLADGDSLKRLLPDNEIEPSTIELLALTLARFYREAESGSEIDRFGSWEIIQKNCVENFGQVADHADTDGIDHRRLRIVEAATRGFLDRHRDLFAGRVQAGQIRDCHGDLRTDHVYLTDRGIQIIDGIEFNRRFRYGDVAGDLAFLAMELDHHGYPHVAGTLMSAFARHFDDHQLFSLLDFYKCYRAMVRLKVACLRLRQTDIEDEERAALKEAIGRYTQLAYRYAMQFSRPTLWVVCGLMATGKSTLARALADSLSIEPIRSDLVRKRLFKSSDREGGATDFGSGIYSQEATSLTYARLLLLAQVELEKGRSVVLDATFSRKDQRREALRLAEEMGAWIIFVQCTCSEATIRKRLLARTDDNSLSDARIQHLDRHQTAFEKMDDLSSPCLIRLDTERPVEGSLGAILATISSPNDCLERGWLSSD
ncbi:MAG: AAA family ATPase [Desulfosarcina sp.]|nr:AAA family ATPase [Desulfosarcina sp.]